MGTYYDCQLKVEGPIESIERFKNLTLEINTESEHSYKTFFERLMPGIDGVIKKEHYDGFGLSETEKESVLLLEDFTDDFYLEYNGSYTFYDWFGKGRLTNLPMWNDQGVWSRLSITETSIIVNFTSNHTPPFILIIGGSKLFPELTFRFSLYALSEMHEFTCIEGSNGSFIESDLELFYEDWKNNRLVYKDENGIWFYDDTKEPCLDRMYIDRRTNILFDRSESNIQRDKSEPNEN